MSTRAEPLPRTTQPHDLYPQASERALELNPHPPWDVDRFAEEQIRALVRQVFFPGWPKPARQVVFSAVDQAMDIGAVCMQVAHALTTQTPGTVCVAEVNLASPELPIVDETKCGPVSAPGGTDSLRKFSRQISDRLWFLPPEQFLGENRNGLSSAWLRGRLGDLRRDFDYTLLHAPPAGLSSEAALLGYLGDGVILVLEASSTRRIAAQRIQSMLQTANARLLGTVLSERTFPIPEQIYRKL